MKGIAIGVGVIVLGNLLGASLSGCILFDDTPANKKACEVYCECVDPTNATCQTDCEQDVVKDSAGPRCTSCFMKHANSCAGLEAECTATCADEGPVAPPPANAATVRAACTTACACKDTPAPTCIDDCIADPDTSALSSTCLGCIATLPVPQCDIASCASACAN